METDNRHMGPSAVALHRNLAVVCASLAVITALLWLWINFCRFPHSSWNDIRLVPVFMAAAGEPVYTLPGTGVITTWMYGPVPLWLWSPAVLGANPVAALLIADGTNLFLTLAAIGLTCAYWPIKGATGMHRWITFAVVIALWPDHTLRFLQADNAAIALGLLANLCLVTNRASPGGIRAWLAALGTALALGCKQNTLGLLAAQLVWLAGAYGWKASAIQLVRILVSGGAVAAVAIWQFGFAQLWFGTVTVGSALPLTEAIGERLWILAPILSIQWGLPLLAFGFIGRKSLGSSHPLSLPLLAWLTSLPLGIYGLLSTGGSTNNLHGFHFLVIALFLSFTIWLERRLQHFHFPLMSMMVASVICARILTADQSPWRPDTQNIHQAIAIQATLPAQVWLPWNPLVSYYGDHRFYHAEDGLYVRFITGHPVSVTQARAHLPERFHAIAFPDPHLQWGVAAKLAPANHTTWQSDAGEILAWRLDAP